MFPKPSTHRRRRSIKCMLDLTLAVVMVAYGARRGRGYVLGAVLW